jgi:hypothetical protein
MAVYSGTEGQLATIRQQWRRLDAAAVAIEQMGHQHAALLRADADTLGGSVVLVSIGCLFCKNKFPEPYPVNGNGWPGVCICGECNDRIAAAIAAKYQMCPRRRPACGKADCPWCERKQAAAVAMHRQQR